VLTVWKLVEFHPVDSYSKHRHDYIGKFYVEDGGAHAESLPGFRGGFYRMVDDNGAPLESVYFFAARFEPKEVS